MPWVNEEFYYTVKLLKAIARWYSSIYEVALIGNYQVTNIFQLVEFKADFDMALKELGKCNSGKQQIIVMADVLGISDYRLRNWGLYRIQELREQAYNKMVTFLNGNIKELA